MCVHVCEGDGERREKIFLSYEFRCTIGGNNRNLTTSAKSPTFVPQNPAGQKRWLTEQEIKTETLVLLSMPVRPTATIPENNQELCTLHAVLFHLGIIYIQLNTEIIRAQFNEY